MIPYYEDEWVTLYHGDCLTVPLLTWASNRFDVMITDPPYGIRWKKGENRAAKSRKHNGILGDEDTSARTGALHRWGDDRPAAVFGSPYAPTPDWVRQVLVWRKPADAGVVGATTSYRRDIEFIYLLGHWPRVGALRSSILESGASMVGGQNSPAGRTGHPHAKPLDVLEQLIAAAPPGVVVDPFAGSGSTLLAARNQGRKSIGVEVEERYCELIAKRLAQGVLL